MIENLKELQDIFESAKQQITRGKEPVEELLKMNGVLKAVVDDTSIIFEKMDDAYRKFFFDTMASGALKALTKEKSRDDKVSWITCDSSASPVLCSIHTHFSFFFLFST
jgi:hypothetical protein